MANTTTSNGGTVLTIPASTLWYGSISLSASLTVGTGVQAAASAAPSITVSSPDGNLVDGDTIVKLQLNTPAQVLGALVGSSSHGDAVIGPMYIQARTSPVVLTLNTGGSTAACGTAIGEM